MSEVTGGGMGGGKGPEPPRARRLGEAEEAQSRACDGEAGDDTP